MQLCANVRNIHLIVTMLLNTEFVLNTVCAIQIISSLTYTIMKYTSYIFEMRYMLQKVGKYCKSHTIMHMLLMIIRFITKFHSLRYSWEREPYGQDRTHCIVQYYSLLQGQVAHA